jgi:hypothetical protein
VGCVLKAAEKLQFWPGFEPQTFKKVKNLVRNRKKKHYGKYRIRPWDLLHAKPKLYHCSTEFI